jgi:hypothetical protein
MNPTISFINGFITGVVVIIMFIVVITNPK